MFALISYQSALERIKVLERALRGVAAHHYEPQYGGYCWCLANRKGALDEHDIDCIAARQALAKKETP